MDDVHSQIQGLVNSVGDMREKLGTLTSGQDAMTRSLNELKDGLRARLTQDDQRLRDLEAESNRMKGSLSLGRWIVASLGLGTTVDFLIRLIHLGSRAK